MEKKEQRIRGWKKVCIMRVYITASSNVVNCFNLKFQNLSAYPYLKFELILYGEKVTYYFF